MKRKMGKGKVKGTVLFTVVTVMLVMVVLLMTTLTLTTSAKRRSYYTYFESQAQYAANAALDAVTYSAYTDTDFHNWVTTDLDDINDAGEIRVNFDGSNIQFTDATNNTVTCRIEKINPDVVWDDATQALHPRDMWRITATASVGNGRNTSTYSVSQFLYENFQAPVQSLPVNALNTGNYTVRNVVTNQNQSQTQQPTPTYSSPAMLTFGNLAFVNNNITLGPCYSNLQKLPIGMLAKQNGKFFYDDIEDITTNPTRKDPNYDLLLTNDKMMSVGNSIYVNNIYHRVKMTAEFQEAGEGVVIYGNLTCNNQPMRFTSKAIRSGSSYDSNCNYVYVDGMVRVPRNGMDDYGNAANSGMIYVGDANSTMPIDLYCGGVDVNGEIAPGNSNGSANLRVTGDVYMYNPEADSVWGGGDEGSPLSNFTAAQLAKASAVDGYATSCGGSIICNNKSLRLGNSGRTFNVPGDIIMTQPGSTLTLSPSVTVSGRIISVGTVTGAANAITGDAAWAYVNSAYYPQAYTTAMNAYNGGKNNYSLMPYLHRIDEVFETYYRWDLWESTKAAADSHIGADPYIEESIKAGHSWNSEKFETPSGDVWVPYTNATQTYWLIKKHPYYNPEVAIGNIVANGLENITTYAGFTGGTALPEYSGTPTTIKTVSHYTDGTVDTNANKAVVLDNYYVVDHSCEIDTTTYNKIFVDPSALGANDTIKIVLKGECGQGNHSFDFIVNNTANYSGGYGNPVAYADNGKYVARSQVRVFLKEGFGHTNANLIMATTGILRQWQSKELSVVQRPIYPDDAGWAALDNEVKYAYELVPNFTVYGQDGALYNFGSNNATLMNADVAMPLSSLKLGTTGDMRKVHYREECNYTESVGELKLWAVGSAMLQGIDINDKFCMMAYIGSEGLSVPTQDTIVPSQGGNDSDENGENRNPFFTPTDRTSG